VRYRAGSGPREADAPDGVVARRSRALRAGLYRPLADDDDRVAYWVRHVWYGVILSEVTAGAVLAYAQAAHTPIHGHPFVQLMAPVVLIGTPLLLFLPLAAMMRDRRGALLFYAWSLVLTGLITVIARLDGGASSPLPAILFLTLAYMAAAYPPQGVVVIGAVMTAAYLFFVALPDFTSYAAFFLVVMCSLTLICAMASTNAWAAHDRQMLLIRTQEALATTDDLTGACNRRAFLDRLGVALEAVGEGREYAVCLVDLDGFKLVNDREGHAAGDAVLKAVTAALAGAVRETDTVARLGGDEFAVLAAVSPSFSGEMLAERLRDAVALAGLSTGVTGSVGIADVRPGDDIEDLLHRADAAMYRSKSAGGNRVTALVP
jgi:diguanylate cyclase (GGDEF)-like protein